VSHRYLYLLNVQLSHESCVVLMVTHANRCLVARFLQAPDSLERFFMCCSKAEFAAELNNFFSKAIVGQTILKETLLAVRSLLYSWPKTLTNYTHRRST